jgi:hypothetical protein
MEQRKPLGGEQGPLPSACNLVVYCRTCEPPTFDQLVGGVDGPPQVAPLLALLHVVAQDTGAPRVARGDPGQVDAVLEGTDHLGGARRSGVTCS